MPSVLFSSLPDDARVWVFGAVQPIVGRDAERLIDAVETFIHGWAAHGQPVVGGCDWRYDHFLIVSADERASGVSGCSIDSLFRTLKTLEAEIGTTLLDSSPVWYRDSAGHVNAVSRKEFRDLVEADEVDGSTVVFDNTVSTVGQIRGGEWELPLSQSWHARAFATRQKTG